MSQPAVSQQLRVLRHLGLVVGERRGRYVVYELHDDHVAALVDEAVHHVEHLRLAFRGRSAPCHGGRALGHGRRRRPPHRTRGLVGRDPGGDQQVESDRAHLPRQRAGREARAVVERVGGPSGCVQ